MKFTNLVDLIQVFANEYSPPSSNVLLIKKNTKCLVTELRKMFQFLNSELIVVDNQTHKDVDIVIDNYRLPFLKESFEIIICFDDSFDLNEIHKVLKPDGRILIKNNNITGSLGRAYFHGNDKYLVI